VVRSEGGQAGEEVEKEMM